MGGVFREKGNYTADAECNIAYDPQAAHDFFSEQHISEICVIPLDVTREVYWTEEMIDAITENNGTNKWVKMMLNKWYEKYGRNNKRVFKLHDPLAMYLTFFPNEAIWEERGIEVILEGKQRGKTSFTPVSPYCHVAMGLKDAQKISRHIASLLFDESDHA